MRPKYKPSDTIDPDVATVLLIVFSGITAAGWVIDFIERHRPARQGWHYRREARRSVELRITTWSANVKELRAQFEGVRRLLESLNLNHEASVIHVKVDFRPADMELMRRQIASLTKLVRSSVDAASRLMREAARGEYFTLSDDEVGQLTSYRENVNRAVAELWGIRNVDAFLNTASKALDDLSEAASLIESHLEGRDGRV